MGNRQIKKTSKIITKDKAQQQIDEILDKISQSGYDSLTKEEKNFCLKLESNIFIAHCRNIVRRYALVP
jgi:hypothetical protein